MNKTINISLGKQFFHIDEEAYLILKNYLDAIRSYLVNEQGQEEILADIEARIAELFLEKLESDREVVQVAEVEGVIKIMGKPSDYKVDQDDNETVEEENSFQQHTKTGKKFYRDIEKNIFGGVCAGLAHNLSVDILWMRIIWLVLFLFSYGTFLLLYIVLWIVVPAARTTAQKLSMMGEPINISNIEKKVKESVDKATEYAKNFDYEKAARNGKSSATRFFDELLKVLLLIGNVLVKIIGFLLVFVAGISLVSMLISLLSFGSISLFGITDLDFGNDWPFALDAPLWLVMFSFFLIAAIPFYFIFLLGLKLINLSLQLFKTKTVITLVVLWFLALFYVIFLGIKKELSSSNKAELIQLQELQINSSDTLSLKMIPNLNYAESMYRSAVPQIKYDSSTQEDILVGTAIYVALQPTSDSLPKVRIRKTASGSSNAIARNNANLMDYQYQINNNELLLNAYFTAEESLKNESLSLHIVLYMPYDMHLKVDKNVSTFKDFRYSNYWRLSNNPEDIYQITPHKLNCTTCVESTPKTQNND